MPSCIAGQGWSLKDQDPSLGSALTAGRRRGRSGTERHRERHNDVGGADP